MSSMLEYKGYHATVEDDAEEDIFVGEVLGIADSLNFHGKMCIRDRLCIGGGMGCSTIVERD